MPGEILTFAWLASSSGRTSGSPRSTPSGCASKGVDSAEYQQVYATEARTPNQAIAKVRPLAEGRLQAFLNTGRGAGHEIEVVEHRDPEIRLQAGEQNMPLKPPPSSESTWKRRELLWESSGTARAACGPDASNIRPPCFRGVCSMPIRMPKSTLIIRTTLSIVSIYSI
jgi:hypothetical protein